MPTTEAAGNVRMYVTGVLYAVIDRSDPRFDGILASLAREVDAVEAEARAQALADARRAVEDVPTAVHGGGSITAEQLREYLLSELGRLSGAAPREGEG